MTGENPKQNCTCTCDTEDSSIPFPCVRWSYLKTPQGYLKAIQMISSLCALICFVTSLCVCNPYCTFFVTVVISVSALTGALLAFHLVGMDQKYPNFPWFETEFISSATSAMFNYLAACFMVVPAIKAGSLIVALTAFFSIGAILAYAIDAAIKYRSIRRAARSLCRASDPEPITEEITV